MLAELSGFLPYVGAYGPSGLFILALLSGHLITKASHERELATLQKALDLREASNAKLQEQQSKLAELTLLAYRSVPREDSDA